MRHCDNNRNIEIKDYTTQFTFWIIKNLKLNKNVQIQQQGGELFTNVQKRQKEGKKRDRSMKWKRERIRKRKGGREGWREWGVCHTNVN